MLTCFNKTVQYIDVSIQEIDEGTNFIINMCYLKSKELNESLLPLISWLFLKQENFLKTVSTADLLKLLPH